MLKPDDLHRAVLGLAYFYYRNFDMRFPALNTPLLLFKYVKELALPSRSHLRLIPFYEDLKFTPVGNLPAAQEIAKVLGLGSAYKPLPYRHEVTDLPEVQLMSTLIIAVKISQGFDDVERHPKTVGEQGTLALDWDIWQKTRSLRQTTARDEGGLSNSEALKMSEAQAFEMDKTQLDQYMDWYATIWVDEAQPRLPQHLLDLFPTERLDGSTAPSVAERHDDNTMDIKTVMAAVRSRSAISDEHAKKRADPNGDQVVERPGSKYKRYRSLRDVPPHTRSLLEAAAQVIAVRTETLVRAVFLFEMELEKCARHRRHQK
ncbi:MAG: Pol I core factor CF [Sclerophora amabilis]|nr:MAG: Pol I core factor CF [Sclerophora amabilis]